MKSAIFICLLLATAFCAPEVEPDMDVKIAELQEQVRFLMGAKAPGYVSLEPLLNLMKTQVDNYFLYNKKTPLLVDFSSMKKLSEEIRNGDLHSLWDFSNKDTVNLLKKMDMATLYMKNTISSYKSATEIFKSGIQTVERVNEGLNHAISRITEAQAKTGVEAILSSLHDRTLKNVHDGYAETNKMTLHPLAGIKESRKIMDRFETKIKADRRAGSDYVEDAINTALGDILDCVVACPNGYKNRLIKGKFGPCTLCVNKFYGDEIKQATQDAFKQLDTLTDGLKPYHKYFHEWETQAQTYTEEYSQNMSKWDKYEGAYHAMFKKIAKQTNIKAHWKQYYNKFKQAFSVFGGSFEALE